MSEGGRSAPPRLSAVVVAQDEETALPGCLESLRFCDEIVLVDGGSRDRTRALAQAAGARVLERPFDDFARQREFGREQARGAWVLSLDADERASPELQAAARRIAGVAGAGSGAEVGPPRVGAAPVAFSLPFRNHFRGAWLRHGGLWPDRHLRLFRRDRCRWDPARPVHERLIADGPVGALAAPVLHYGWSSLAHCLRKSQGYAERAAQAMHARGERAGLSDLLARPLWRFLRAFLFQAGFLDGRAGAVVAFARAFEAWARAARLWELGRFGGGGGKDALP